MRVYENIFDDPVEVINPDVDEDINRTEDDNERGNEDGVHDGDVSEPMDGVDESDNDSDTLDSTSSIAEEERVEDNESGDDGNETEEEFEVTESTHNATMFELTYVLNPHVEWFTKSKHPFDLTEGLKEFLCRKFNMVAGSERKITGFTEYHRNVVTFRCHPAYRGGNKWNDWVMCRYLDNEDNVKKAPACIATFIVDSANKMEGYQAVIQWAGKKRDDNSVLFQPYQFVHDYNNNPWNSYEMFSVEAFDSKVFVIDCATDKFKKILRVKNREKWPKYFL